MGFRIEDRNDIDAQFSRAVNRTVGVDRRKAPIGSDQIVQIMLVIEPIPSRHDDVALGPLRPCRFGMGQLALGDAVGPVRQIFDRDSAEIFGHAREHRHAALSRLDAAKPRLLGIGELAHRERHILGKGARRARANRMAVGTTVRLHLVQISVLGQLLGGLFPRRQTRSYPESSSSSTNESPDKSAPPRYRWAPPPLSN